MAASHIFKVVFANQGKVYEIYARKVSHGALFGFVEVEDITFGERSAVVVDPAEEKVKAEFEGVARTFLQVILPRSASFARTVFELFSCSAPPHSGSSPRT